MIAQVLVKIKVKVICYLAKKRYNVVPMGVPSHDECVAPCVTVISANRIRNKLSLCLSREETKLAGKH